MPSFIIILGKSSNRVFLGSIIDTVSYINIYDQCYDMNTNGPYVVKVRDYIASNHSYKMINVLTYEQNKLLSEDIVNFFTGHNF